MASIAVPLLFVFSVLSCSGSATLASATADGASPASNRTDDASFIRTCCARTLYPRLCYASLSPYAGSVQSNPARLARFAINTTLARLVPLSARIAALRRRAATSDDDSVNGGGRAAEALKDCSEAIGDGADLARESEKELEGLEQAVGPAVTWRIGNAQTWLSAVITDEDTCTDGFEGVVGPRGSRTTVKAEVCRRVRTVRQYTSNALALVNSLVHYRT